MRHQILKRISATYNQSLTPLPQVIQSHSHYGAVRLEPITPQAVRVVSPTHGVIAVLARQRTGHVYPIRRGPRW